MLSYDIAGYFATWPQRLHALFQHIKTYREQNRQYVILSNATHRQIELHKAFYSTCRRHTHHVQTTRSVFVCLGIPRFPEGKKLVARISKSEPLILKYKAHIFYLLPHGFNGVKISFHSSTQKYAVFRTGNPCSFCLLPFVGS